MGILYLKRKFERTFSPVAMCSAKITFANPPERNNNIEINYNLYSDGFTKQRLLEITFFISLTYFSMIQFNNFQQFLKLMPKYIKFQLKD